MDLVFLDTFFFSTIFVSTIVEVGIGIGLPFGIAVIEVFVGTGGVVGIFAIVAVAVGRVVIRERGRGSRRGRERGTGPSR